MKKVFYIFIVCVLLMAASAAQSYSYTTLYVSTNGSDSNTGSTPSDPLLTIDTAINAIENGGEILVFSGTYNENVLLSWPSTLNITLKPSTETSVCTLDAGGTNTAFRLWGVTKITIESFTIQNGYGNGIGSGFSLIGTDIHLKNVILKDCVSLGSGVALQILNSSFVKADNCLFYNNTNTSQINKASFAYGTGISKLSATNCVFYGNSGTTWFTNALTTFEATNSIFLDNDSIFYATSTPVDITYSNIESELFVSGTGNISLDPKFINATNKDFHLSSSSPCIETGTTEGASAKDLDGNTKPFGKTVDMGAYEFDGLALNLTSPTGGEIIEANKTFNINWIILEGYPLQTNPINLRYSTNEGNSWITITTGISSVAPYPWNVPNDPSGKCRVSIEVTALDSSVAIDSSNSNFRIKSYLNEVFVSPTGSDESGSGTQEDPFKTIGFALTNVATGATINLFEGTYYEFLIWPNRNNITLKTSNETTIATLDANGVTGQSLISTEATVNLTIEGLTLTGANTWDNGIWTNGGGIYLKYTGSRLDLNNVIIKYCEGEFGGALYCQGSTVYAYNSTFSSNEAKQRGGAIHGDLGLNLTNCTINDNTAAFYSGGIYSGYATNCVFYNNSVTVLDGGGALLSTLTNCIFYNNSAAQNGGGVDQGVITNCTFYGNTASNNGDNLNGGTAKNIISWNGDIYGTNINNSVIESGTGYSGSNNIFTDPKFVNAAGYDFHLTSSSPCIDTGSVSGPPLFDFDYNNRPLGFGYDMGAYEYVGQYGILTQPDGGNTVTSEALYNIIYNVTPEVDEIYIRLSTNEGYSWDIELTHEAWAHSGVTTFEWTNLDLALISSECLISIEASGSAGTKIITSASIFSIVPPPLNLLYVSPNGSDSNVGRDVNFPKKTIQNAINSIEAGGEILAFSGTYAEHIIWPATQNITLKASTETSVCTIDGTSNGRCIEVITTNKLTIEGFTIANGLVTDLNGAGMLLYSNVNSKLWLKNVIFNNNQAVRSADWPEGGAIRGGPFPIYAQNCTFTNNRSERGGAMLTSYAYLENCIFDNNEGNGNGGGALTVFTTLVATNCSFSNNSSTQSGGAFVSGAVYLYNCLLVSNEASNYGGLAFGTDITAFNCIFMNNKSGTRQMHYFGTFNIVNSIFKGNTVPLTDDSSPQIIHSNIQSNGWVSGTGNTSEEPDFVDQANGNYRLNLGSPCLDSGTSEGQPLTATDYAGNNRIIGTEVDMGIYEMDFPSVSIQSPNGGEQYTDEDITITWTATYSAGILPNSVTVEYSLNGGTTWEELATLDYTGLNGIYTWESPARNSDQALVRVRITGSDLLLGQDESNGVFELIANNLYVSPTGNDLTGIGSITNPYKTLTKAFSEIPAGGNINLLPGIHTLEAAVYWPDKNNITLKLSPEATEPAIINENEIYVYQIDTIMITIEGIDFIDSRFHHYHYFLQNNIIFIRNVTFKDCTNSAIYSNPGHPVFYLENVKIDNCSSPDFGAAVRLDDGNTVVYATNCIFINNSAPDGGVGFAGQWNVTNCTFYNNSAGNRGGVAYWASSWNSVNSIYWDNTAPNGAVLNTATNIDMTYCNIQDNILISGEGNISQNPSFLDAANGDFHISSFSPCINVGTSEGQQLPTYDIEGNDRIIGIEVDMGAYEAPPSPVVEVLSPNGGESFNNESITVSWTAAFPPDGLVADSVTIEYSYDLGNNWFLIAEGEANDGIYTWEAPGINMSGALISVNILGADTGNTIGGDTSNATFEVIWPVIYVSPTGSDEAGNGSSMNPYKTIQKGLDEIIPTGEVRLMSGIYTIPPGDFVNDSMVIWPNKSNITLKIDPNATEPATIDAQGNGRFIRAANLTTAYNLTIEGITIQEGGVTGSLYWGTVADFSNSSIAVNLKDLIIKDCLYYAFLSSYTTYNIDSCIIMNNNEPFSGSYVVYNINNSVIFNNSCTNFIHDDDTPDINISNSIFWNNGGPVSNRLPNTSIKYSIIQQDRFITDEGNSYEDPKFIDTANGNFRLSEGSICIDGGTTEANYYANDLDQNPRPHNNIPDIGAYEFQGPLVKVLQPNGGEVYVSGEAITIAYLLNDDYGIANAVTIEYTTNEGTSWTEISTEPYTGLNEIYTWEAPAQSSSQIKIKVSASNLSIEALNNYDTSNNVFAIIESEIFVSPTGSDIGGGTAENPLQTIQRALDLIPSGGTINLFSGTYFENIVWPDKNNITLKASNETSAPTIDAWDGTYKRCISVEAVVNITIEGITFKNGRGYDPVGDNHHGGAIALRTPGSNLWIYNSTFTNNGAFYGGAIYGPGSNIYVSDSLFISNEAFTYGGAIYVTGSELIVNNCQFITNEAASDASAIYGDAQTIVSDSLFYGNISNISIADGALYGGTAISCTFEANRARKGGGVYGGNSVNCLFKDNFALTSGGGQQSGTSKNSVFIGNHSNGSGGGAYGVTMTNCTLYGNTVSTGNGNNIYGSTVRNCISRNGDVYSVSANYSNIQSGSYSGTGNITTEPRFVDAGSENFRLLPDSPCIDTGSPIGITATDYDGNNRRHGFEVDMGAFEFQGPSISIESPIGGEIWGLKTTKEVSWNISGEVTGDIYVRLSTNEGITWDHLLTQELAAEGQNSYSWYIPIMDASDKCLISIEATNSSGISTYRTIKDTFTVMSLYVYVSTTGDDINGNGTYDNPFRSIQKAMIVAPPAAEIRLQPGIYTTDEAYFTNESMIIWSNFDDVVIKLSPEATGVATIDAQLYGRCISVESAIRLGLENVTIANGKALNGLGGGIYLPENCELNIYNVTFTDNTCIQGAYYEQGGAIYTEELGINRSTINIDSCNFIGNSAPGGYGGAIHGGILYIKNSLFSGNNTDNNGVGGTFHQTTIVSTNCTYSQNYSGQGGVAASSWPIEFHNDLFLNNGYSSAHGGVFYSSDKIHATNCLFLGNIADEGGITGNGSFEAINCIFKDNVATIANESIRYFDNGSIKYSYMQPIGYITGEGNTSHPPLFIDEPGGDYRLSHRSMLLNSGTSEGIAIPDHDRAGNERIYGPGVDIGPYEMHYPSMTIISPNGGEIYDKADIPITWTGTYEYGFVANSATIEYSLDGGNNWNILTEGQPYSGTYTWITPEMTSDQMLVAVTALGNTLEALTGYGRSFATFEAKWPLINVSLIGNDNTGDGSFANPFRTIQKGLNTANDGDVVLVHNGIYTTDEAYITAKEYYILWPATDNITLKGVGNVTIDAGGFGRAIETEFAYINITIESITIQNGYSAPGSGAGIYRKGTAGSLNLNKVNFINCNAPSSSGGAVYVLGDISLNIKNSIFNNCSATYGGALGAEGGTHYVKSSVFLNNSATDQGGAIRTGNWNIINCTFYNNSAGSAGGIGSNINSWNSINSIYWNNTPIASNMFGLGSPNITYSNIQDNYLITGEGNISIDPKFVNASNGDLHLYAGSPCIDSGTSEGQSLSEFDVEGNSRIYGFDVGMGAYEFQYPSIKVIAPNGGENLPTEISNDFSWLISGETAGMNINIRVSTDEGITWDDYLIHSESAIAGLNSHSYIYPDTFVGQKFIVSIEVEESGTMLNYDISNDKYSVTPRRIYVSTTGSDITGNGLIGDPFRSIGKAFIKAASDNAEILLLEGVHSTSEAFFTDNSMLIWPNKANMVLKLAPEATGPATIDAMEYGRCISLEAPVDIRIENITLMNGMVTDESGAALFLPAGTYATLEGVTVQNNTAIADTGSANGGAIYSDNANVAALNSIFKNNNAENGGVGFGGEWNNVNSLFIDNSAEDNGGVFSTLQASLINCLVIDNQAAAEGGVVHTVNWNVVNTIILNNSDSGSYPIARNTTGTVKYSNIQETGYIDDEGNNSYSPSFVDQSNGDYHLLPGSLIADQGTSEAPGLPATDHDGKERKYGLSVDIGPFESRMPSVNIISPNGGEVYNNSDIPITWTTTYEYGIAPNSVTIEYSLDVGQTWFLLADQLADTGSYNWVDPELTNNDLLISIKVTGSSNEAVFAHDISNAKFEAIWPIVLVSSSGNDTTGGGSTLKPYRTIQKGLNMVPIAGEVRALAGTYTTDEAFLDTDNLINWPNKHDITLKGIGKPILDGKDRGRLIDISPSVRATIEGFVIKNGYSAGNGAAINITSGSSTIQLRKVKISDNNADNGGAVYADGSTIRAYNSILNDNASSSDGGAIYGGDWTAINCVFYNNNAGGNGGVASNGTWDGINNILWANTAVSENIFYNIIAPNITYSNIQDNYLSSGTGNLSLNPDFAGVVAGDFSLTESSPLLDVGSVVGYDVPSFDYGGNPRIANDYIDLGAFEAKAAPRVWVLSPNGGELYYQSDIPITWATTYELGIVSNSVTIEYSLDKGFNWSILAENLADTGSYTWTSPEVNSNEMLVKVSVLGISTEVLVGFDISNATFEAVWPIVRVSPTGNDTFGEGTTIKPFRTIQKGLNNVPVNGEVWLASGTYSEHDIIWPNTNNITLKMDPMATEPVTIDAENIDRAFTVNNYGSGLTVNFEDLTITNGIGSGSIIYSESGNIFYLNNLKIYNSGSTAFSTTNANVTAVNCIFDNNYSVADGGTWNVMNCSFTNSTNNIASNATWQAINSIIWNNSIPAFNTMLDNDISYSNIQANAFIAGTGNISTEPIFIDEVNKDFRLEAGSKGIDAGTLESISLYDIDGNTRNYGFDPDIGPYEFQGPSIRMIYPNDKTVLAIEDKTHDISWIISGEVSGDVQIRFIDGSSSSWTNIAQQTAAEGLGVYSWTIPETTLVDCFISIEAGNSSGLFNYDMSDSAFSIRLKYMYVSTLGDDSNDGSMDNPFRSIQKALDVVPEFGEVRLHPGTYTTDEVFFYYTDDMITWPNKENITLKLAPTATSVATIDVGTYGRFLNVGYPVNLSIEGITITSGEVRDKDGGAIHISSGAVLNLTNVIMKNNNVTVLSETPKGGAIYSDNAIINATNSYFENNSGYTGGVAYGGTWNAKNCIFSNNSAIDAGGVVSNPINWDVVNCTFVENNAPYGGVANSGSFTRIINSIFWDNDASISGYVFRLVNPQITYSNIQANAFISGTGNIASTPEFVAAEKNDYHIKTGSPCKDAGLYPILGISQTDIDGDSRVNGAQIDMGADEFKNDPPQLLLDSIRVDNKEIPEILNLSIKPVFEGKIIDKYGRSRLPIVELMINDTVYTAEALEVLSETDTYYFTVTSEAELGKGNHFVSINVINAYGETDYFENSSFKIAKTPSVSGKPKNIPNPFKPGHGEITELVYTLSTDANIKLIIYDITGRAIWQRSYAQGQNGGKIDENRILWNGMNDYGHTVGNGVYIYLIVSDGNVLAKGRLSIID